MLLFRSKNLFGNNPFNNWKFNDKNSATSDANILKTVRALFVELEFIETYENQAQYQETKAWLESQGFTAIAQDFVDTVSWIYGNVLFVKLG